MRKAMVENPCRNMWKDKKKEKFDQRKKRFKPPLNRNELNKNYQN
jgi:hypothetical protein